MQPTVKQGESAPVLTQQILTQLIVILITVQLFGYLAGLIGQQWVIGEIVAGIALGPSLLGAIAPGLKTQLFPAETLPTLTTLGQIGLVLYMFSLGARVDIGLMLRQSHKAIIVSFSGILLPLALGAGLAFFLYPRFAGPHATLLSFVLLVGTAMAITAFPVLARLLAEKNMLDTRVGVLALTCAAVGDVVAWCLLALVVALTQADGRASSAVMTVGLTVLFAAVMVAAVRPALAYAADHIPSNRLFISLSIILLLASAAITSAIGIHPVFGAFLMGLILPRRAVVNEHISGVDQANNGLFLPLYFVASGLNTQIGLIHGLALWLLCLLVLAIACFGKFVGSALATRWLGDSWREALTLGVLMNTRGLVELIVLNIGLQTGVLSPTLFAMLVIMAVVTTGMASPLLPWLGYRQSRQLDVPAAPGPEKVSPLTP
jgi:Kef-type K+ transport system membrane component KefB